MNARPRYLVVAPSWVGDLVMAQPLLTLLKRAAPDCVIDVLAPDWVLPLVARMPEVNDAIALPIQHRQIALAKRWRIARTLAQRHFDAAYVLPNSYKSALIPWFAGIPRRVGYVGEARYGVITDARKLDVTKLPRLVDRFVALATTAETPYIGTAPEPQLRVDATQRQKLLERLNLRYDVPTACLCPGAEYGPAKRWPPQYFADLTQRLRSDGFQVWLLGSKKDAEITAEINRLSGGVAIDLAGATRLDEAVDLLSCSAIVVSNDSGLMHVAAAVQRPLIALFGSSSPDYTPPLSQQARVVRFPIECSPCFERTCPLGHFNCMMQLTPENVYQHIQTALQIDA